MLFLTFIVLTAFCNSCKKDNFDIDHPDVETFVKQLKDGTYNKYETNDKGENLWLKMPKFSETHIPLLIALSKDTTHIKNFPVNPMSSRSPFPEGRSYFILGEGLLWIVDGIIKATAYTSLDPFLIDVSKNEAERYKGITTREILKVQEIYANWQKSNRALTGNPLENSPYRWF